jgi:nucleotide-binding universal stress UspA family protein
MISIKKILFPTDFSECADYALVWAIMLAKNFEAELAMFHAVVLHSDDVGDEVYSRFPDFEKVVQTLVDNADTQLEKAIPDKGEVNVRHVVKRGFSASDEILDFAESENIDLITVGTHGRKGFSKLFLGSVTDKLIHRCSCPILTVRCSSAGNELADFRRVVLPIDFSDHSRLAARYAAALAEATGAELEVIHVIDKTVHPSFYSVGMDSLLELDSELRERAEKATAEFMKETGAATDFKTIITEGRPSEEITDYAGDNGESLIVIASHGAGALERIMIGSTTERVIHLAECPVLVVKKGERDFVK